MTGQESGLAVHSFVQVGQEGQPQDGLPVWGYLVMWRVLLLGVVVHRDQEQVVAWSQCQVESA